jgi:hypothetical protein
LVKPPTPKPPPSTGGKPNSNQPGGGIGIEMPSSGGTSDQEKSYWQQLKEEAGKGFKKGLYESFGMTPPDEKKELDKIRQKMGEDADAKKNEDIDKILKDKGRGAATRLDRKVDVLGIYSRRNYQEIVNLKRRVSGIENSLMNLKKSNDETNQKLAKVIPSSLRNDRGRTGFFGGSAEPGTKPKPRPTTTPKNLPPSATTAMSAAARTAGFALRAGSAALIVLELNTLWQELKDWYYFDTPEKVKEYEDVKARIAAESEKKLEKIEEEFENAKTVQEKINITRKKQQIIADAKDRFLSWRDARINELSKSEGPSESTRKLEQKIEGPLKLSRQEQEEWQAAVQQNPSLKTKFQNNPSAWKAAGKPKTLSSTTPTTSAEKSANTQSSSLPNEQFDTGAGPGGEQLNNEPIATITSKDPRELLIQDIKTGKVTDYNSFMESIRRSVSNAGVKDNRSIAESRLRTWAFSKVAEANGGSFNGSGPEAVAQLIKLYGGKVDEEKLKTRTDFIRRYQQTGTSATSAAEDPILQANQRLMGTFARHAQQQQNAPDAATVMSSSETPATDVAGRVDRQEDAKKLSSEEVYVRTDKAIEFESTDKVNIASKTNIELKAPNGVLKIDTQLIEFVQQGYVLDQNGLRKVSAAAPAGSATPSGPPAPVTPGGGATGGGAAGGISGAMTPSVTSPGPGVSPSAPPAPATPGGGAPSQPVAPGPGRGARRGEVSSAGAAAGPSAAAVPAGAAAGSAPEASSHNFTPRERATLDFISRREGSADPNVIYGDPKGKGGTGRFSKQLQQMGYTKPLTDMSVTEVLAMQKDLTKITKGTLRHSPGLGTSAVGTGQMIRGTLIANLKKLGIPESEWGTIKFDKTLQERLTLQNFKSSGIGDPNADPRTWNQRRLGQQYESIDTAKGKAPMSGAEMGAIANASAERPTQVAGATETPAVGPQATAERSASDTLPSPPAQPSPTGPPAASPETQSPPTSAAPSLAATPASPPAPATPPGPPAPSTPPKGPLGTGYGAGDLRSIAQAGGRIGGVSIGEGTFKGLCGKGSRGVVGALMNHPHFSKGLGVGGNSTAGSLSSNNNYLQQSGLYQGRQNVGVDQIKDKKYLDSLPIGTVISAAQPGHAGHVQVKGPNGVWISDSIQRPGSASGPNGVLLRNGRGPYNNFAVHLPNEKGMQRMNPDMLARDAASRQHMETLRMNPKTPTPAEVAQGVPGGPKPTPEQIQQQQTQIAQDATRAAAGQTLSPEDKGKILANMRAGLPEDASPEAKAAREKLMQAESALRMMDPSNKMLPENQAGAKPADAARVASVDDGAPGFEGAAGDMLTNELAMSAVSNAPDTASSTAMGAGVESGEDLNAVPESEKKIQEQYDANRVAADEAAKTPEQRAMDAVKSMPNEQYDTGSGMGGEELNVTPDAVKAEQESYNANRDRVTEAEKPTPLTDEGFKQLMAGYEKDYQAKEEARLQEADKNATRMQSESTMAGFEPSETSGRSAERIESELGKKNLEEARQGEIRQREKEATEAQEGAVRATTPREEGGRGASPAPGGTNAESARPSPGNDGYGSQKDTSDMPSICTI